MQHSNSRSPTRGRRVLAAAGCAVVLVAGTAAAASSPVAVTDPAQLVDPFIGTGVGGKYDGGIHTYPGAVVPFGMLSWSPATTSRPPGGDYAYADHDILGFALTHLSGPGCAAAAAIPILPTTGSIGAAPDAAQAAFEHAHEHATAGTYDVTLAPGTAGAIGVRLAATLRTGIGYFRFPAGGAANFLFKVSDGQTLTSAAQVQVIGDRKLAGVETAGRFCGTPASTTLYFVAEFDQPFASFGTWGPGAPVPGQRSLAGAHAGAWVTFAAGAAHEIGLKVAISYVSEANAWANLAAENSGWDFAKVAGAAQADWKAQLARIAIAGGSHDQQVEFYTALYHALLHPNVFSDANGEYIGFDHKVHTLPPGQQYQYANYSGWDIYRTQIPLLALLVPKRTSDMVASLLNDQAQGGWLPKWGYANTYTGIMNGDAADPIIAGAYAFGARDFDTRAALAAMLKGADDTTDPMTWAGMYVERPNLKPYLRLGYVPDNASETLEYAIADSAIAALAKALGDDAVHARFLARSDNWRRLFNPNAEYRGFKGYIEARNAEGDFPKGSPFELITDPRQQAFGQTSYGFVEGSTSQYTWMVPQDLGGLIAAMGGDAKATARLDDLFTELNAGPDSPYYWAGKAIGVHAPWIYNYTGAPWKTQAVVRRLLDQLYSATPGGEPGNDAMGATSAWLVWACLGLYPETPGQPVLVVSTPRFPHATITLANGHRVEIDAAGAPGDAYVGKLAIDGQAWPRTWLAAQTLMGAPDATTRIDYTLSAGPNRDWGAAPADRPPSWAPARAK
ncbi:MAG TPA: GH92 family glycosyl hydrolase [Rhodanobacteraceae bacterium]|nr:GH92 family glycosyl hydrolase [Rhodanobacteraceae bacterium]